MMQGFILIDRDIINHPIVGIENPKRFAAWMWMLTEARWKKSTVFIKGKTVVLERGQLSCSYRFMAKKVHMTIQQIRTFFSALKTDTLINIETNTGQMVITICNYDIYQDIEKYNNKRPTQQITRHQHGTNTASTQTRIPDKEGKEGKQVKTCARANEFLEDCLKAAEIDLMRNPNRRITEQCEKYAAEWLGKGMNFETHIGPVIREIVNRHESEGKPVPVTLKYYHQPVLERYALAKPNGDADDWWDKYVEQETAQWMGRVKNIWLGTGKWMEEQWGPPPDQPHTQVPQGILEKFGIKPRNQKAAKC